MRASLVDRDRNYPETTRQQLACPRAVNQKSNEINNEISLTGSDRSNFHTRRQIAGNRDAAFAYA
jgi:hypothetical protein